MHTVIVRMFTAAGNAVPGLRGTVEVPGHEPEPFDDEAGLLALLHATLRTPKAPQAR